jgi:uncharacterized membrane protein
MTQQERELFKYIWSGLVVFVSLLILDGGFWKAVLIGVFFGVSSMFNLGRRWLLRISLAIGVVTVAVIFGFPPPQDWPNLAKAGVNAFNNARGCAMLAN